MSNFSVFSCSRFPACRTAAAKHVRSLPPRTVCLASWVWAESMAPSPHLTAYRWVGLFVRGVDRVPAVEPRHPVEADLKMCSGISLLTAAGMAVGKQGFFFCNRFIFSFEPPLVAGFGLIRSRRCQWAIGSLPRKPPPPLWRALLRTAPSRAPLEAAGEARWGRSTADKRGPGCTLKNGVGVPSRLPPERRSRQLGNPPTANGTAPAAIPTFTQFEPAIPGRLWPKILSTIPQSQALAGQVDSGPMLGPRCNNP